MLKKEADLLVNNIRMLFNSETKISVYCMAHFIEKTEDRRLVDFKQPNGSYRTDYIDSGRACIILQYDDVAVREQIKTKLEKICKIISDHGFSDIQVSEHSLSQRKEYGEMIVSFRGIKE